jgi:hypothetical protein
MGRDSAVYLTVSVAGQVDLDQAELFIRVGQRLVNEVSGDACVSEGGHC